MRWPRRMISAMSRSPAARRYSTSRSSTAPDAPVMPSMDGLLEDDDGGSDLDGDHLQSEPASPVPGRSSRPDDAPSPADQAHDEDSATSSAESSDGDDEHMQRSTASLSSAPGSPRRPRRMASSIHAIHQPLAQARESADAVGSDAADSEPASPEAGPSGMRFTSPVRSPSSSTLLPPRDRSATVTDRRKQSSDRIRQLAEKLREVFDLDEAEEVIAEFPCWLFRRVLLQGPSALGDPTADRCRLPLCHAESDPLLRVHPAEARLRHPHGLAEQAVEPDATVPSPLVRPA